MLNQSTKSTLVPASTNQYRLAPQRLALTIMWLVTTVVTISMLLLGVRDTNQYRVARLILQAGYVAALLWYLSRSGSSISQLPELGPHLFPRWRVGPWIPVLGIALLFALTLVSDDGVYIMMLLMMVATGPILLVWRSEIRLRSVVQGLALAFIAFLAGLQMAKNGYLSNLSLYLLPAFSFPMYIAGGLLFERTRLGGIQLLVGQYGKSVTSVILGALLFIPLGLFNAASGSPGPGPTGVTKWWMPLWLPWFSGITEETWFRLLLVGLIYFLLRPVFQKHPALAVLAAILFSGITFGLGHGRTLDIFLTTGLLYGVPLAAIFARRDWEYAVGAHYMINMIPTLMVFLET